MSGNYVPPLSGVEVPNDRVRKARELAERAEDALPEQVGRFIEAYVGGEFKVGLRCTLGQAANYGFTLSALRHADRGCLEASMECVANPQGNWQDMDGEQALMLADNIEVMEGVQKFIPSLVRVTRFYEISCMGGEGLYEFVPLVISAKELGAAVSDRKVSLVHKSWAVAQGQRGSQNIEAATNGVNVSARLDIETERKRLFFEHYDLIVRNVRWKIFNTHINVSVEPDIQSLTEGWEMGYGPVDRRLCM